MSNTKKAIKKVLKTGLKAVRSGAKKNRYANKAIVVVRNVLFPNILNSQNVYDHLRYYPTVEDYYEQVHSVKDLKEQPLISIVMPTYNTPETYLRKCIDSVIIQSYSKWELCVADDASSDPTVAKVLAEYAERDSRIKYTVRKKNGHISAATNSAIELAKGEYIALLDHDDIVWPNALYEIVRAINDDPEVDFVYTDEDKINSDGDIHSFPFFKPDWSPEFLESCNYITHFSTVRASIIKQVGGFRVGYEGAQDWDLFLRVVSKTQKVKHIAKVLYSWRIHESSTAYNTDAKPYVYEAQKKLLIDHVDAGKYEGKVSQGIIKQHSSVQYSVVGQPKVSAVVAAFKLDETRRCLQSVLNTANYTNLEVVIVSDATAPAALVKYANDMARSMSHVRHAHHEGEFTTVPAAYNFGFRESSGEYLVWLEPDIQVASGNWLELMLGDAQREGVGMVGAKIVNANRTEYVSAGVGLGIDGFCGDILKGVALEDIHYMRGLYGQSRRNTIAARGMMMAKKTTLEAVGFLDENFKDMRLADVDGELVCTLKGLEMCTARMLKQ